MPSEPSTATSDRSMPGGVMLSRIKVYDTPSPDGDCGGTPHLHLACSETYVPLAGDGAVELIDATGYRRIALRPDRLLAFTPGTVHRLINLDGALEVLVIMQNAGLPELGDAVMTFPDEVLADTARYRGAAEADTFERARERRDLGVRGFMELRASYERSAQQGRAALDALHRRAAAIVKSDLPQWEAVVRRGPLREAERSLAAIAALQAGRHDSLTDAHAWQTQAEPAAALGMCGQITRFDNAKANASKPRNVYSGL